MQRKSSTSSNSMLAVAPSSIFAPSPPAQKPLYLCKPFVDAALVKGNLKTIVMLPKYVDIIEWVAINSTELGDPPVFESDYIFLVSDFYHNLNEFYGTIAECCTPRTCPTMSASAR